MTGFEPGPLVSKATALPTLPEPLPSRNYFKITFCLQYLEQNWLDGQICWQALETKGPATASCLSIKDDPSSKPLQISFIKIPLLHLVAPFPCDEYKTIFVCQTYNLRIFFTLEIILSVWWLWLSYQSRHFRHQRSAV